ncbi:MAG: glutamate--tRNA ligase [Parcubacteria group bacterium]|nr:glutamate--tRNA ligase [Parcubacteria group bacterium]
MKNKIITRFAPSPTGTLHVGAARTALFNFLFSKQKNGEMILRIEDTDRERSKKEYETDILESLKWLGITHPAFFRQSERKEIYQKHIAALIRNGHAYVAEDSVIRFKNPNKKIIFTDLVRGDIIFDTTELHDFVIARNESDPLYHLAVVIDDYEMNVTHIIRGEDHVSNTPRQILIQEAIGAPRPLYIHIPLILSPDRSKLSKRHGAMSVLEYRKEGYLPEALINFMVLLGWSPQHGKDNNEVFSTEELINVFSIEGIQKSGAVFNIDKLKWINREHIKRLSRERLHDEIKPFLPLEAQNMSEASLAALIAILTEKIDVFGDIRGLYDAGELTYFWEQPAYEKKGLLWKNETDLSVVKKYLSELMSILSQVGEKEFTALRVKEGVWEYATEMGRGSVLWPFRFALSGKEKSSDPFAIAEVLGKEETLRRLEHAKKLI